MRRTGDGECGGAAQYMGQKLASIFNRKLVVGLASSSVMLLKFVHDLSVGERVDVLHSKQAFMNRVSSKSKETLTLCCLPNLTADCRL